MHIGAFRIWCRHIRGLQNVWPAPEGVTVYRWYNNQWFDEQEDEVSDQSLVRRLDDRRQKNVPWRPKRDASKPNADKVSYFPVAEFDAVIEAKFNAPTRQGSRIEIQERVLDLVKVARFEFNATHHDLIGLPNRQSLNDLMRDKIPSHVSSSEEESEQVSSTFQGQRFTLIAIDIDNFKQVNDSHGHHYGDIVLRCVGSRLKSIEEEIREFDVELFVTHPSGEEFVALVVENGSSSRSHEIAEKLRSAICDNFLPNRDEVQREIGNHGLAADLFPMRNFVWLR